MPNLPQEFSTASKRRYGRATAVGLGIAALGFGTGFTTYELVGQSYDKTAHHAQVTADQLVQCDNLLLTLPGYRASIDTYKVRGGRLTVSITKKCGLEATPKSANSHSVKLIGDKALAVQVQQVPDSLLIPGNQAVQQEVEHLHHEATADRSSRRNLLAGLGALPGIYMGLFVAAGAKNGWQGINVF